MCSYVVSVGDNDTPGQRMIAMNDAMGLIENGGIIIGAVTPNDAGHAHAPVTNTDSEAAPDARQSPASAHRRHILLENEQPTSSTTIDGAVHPQNSDSTDRPP